MWFTYDFQWACHRNKGQRKGESIDRKVKSRLNSRWPLEGVSESKNSVPMQDLRHIGITFMLGLHIATLLCLNGDRLLMMVPCIQSQDMGKSKQRRGTPSEGSKEAAHLHPLERERLSVGFKLDLIEDRTGPNLIVFKSHCNL